jgi:hypothetical protein
MTLDELRFLKKGQLIACKSDKDKTFVIMEGFTHGTRALAARFVSLTDFKDWAVYGPGGSFPVDMVRIKPGDLMHKIDLSIIRYPVVMVFREFSKNSGEVVIVDVRKVIDPENWYIVEE